MTDLSPMACRQCQCPHSRFARSKYQTLLAHTTFPNYNIQIYGFYHRKRRMMMAAQMSGEKMHFRGRKRRLFLNYCVCLSLLRHINCIASAMQTSLHCSWLLRIFAALRTKRNGYEQFYRSEMCNIAYCRCHVRCSVVLLHYS